MAELNGSVAIPRWFVGVATVFIGAVGVVSPVAVQTWATVQQHERALGDLRSEVAGLRARLDAERERNERAPPARSRTCCARS